MSLSLPYPSMSFVPLDILTAEEMNQIVANYEYISNQFPLSSDKIDWATIPTVLKRIYFRAGATGSSGSVTFTPSTLDGTWLLAVSKSSSDSSVTQGYGAALVFVRAGGTAEILNGYSGNVSSSVSDRAITVSGLPSYARCAIYEFYTV